MKALDSHDYELHYAYTTITDDDEKLFIHCRRTFAFWEGKPWAKQINPEIKTGTSFSQTVQKMKKHAVKTCSIVILQPFRTEIH